MTDAPSIDAAIASECRRLGRTLAQLEEGLVGFTRGDIDQRGLITEMQAIDAAHQTLEDLARILEVLARPAPIDDARMAKALATVRQASVRARLLQSVLPGLEGAIRPIGPRPPAPEDIELW